MTPGSDRLPCAPPWTYHPPGQPKPCTAISLRFHPFGGANGVGCDSEVGSWRTATWLMPRLTVLVSMRTTYGMRTPASVVVVATSAGRLVVLGSGLNVVPPTGR